MERSSVEVPVTLRNGAVIRIEATPSKASQRKAGKEDVAYGGTDVELDVARIPANFDDVAKAIEGIAQSLAPTIERVKPKKASVEFGLEVGAETSGLTALLVKGSGTANLKVTLEWS